MEPQHNRTRRAFLVDGLRASLAAVMLPSIARPEERAAPPPAGALEPYPTLERLLRAEAGRNAARLEAGPLRLEASRGILAKDSARLEATSVRDRRVGIPADGLLTFAVDVPETTYATGTLWLSPDRDLRPGLRAYVLCDSTLIAAPMVTAAPWGGGVTDPAPLIRGEQPPERCELGHWLLPRGRHYLTVAGPHLRSAGAFQALEIARAEKPVQEPLYQFALLSDTHVTQRRATWMNVKMGAAAAPELRETLQALGREKTALALLAGDMTDRATREEFAWLARALRDRPVPVYGCLGNHDVYLPTSRPDALELLPDLFPGGATDYAFQKAPLRFVVLDFNTIERERLDWLREVLAQDTATPTVVVWHFPFHNRGEPSSCGYRMPVWSEKARELLQRVQATPNVCATLNGHGHWDEVNVRDGITHVQNAAICEWPNSYRVFRVYPDRLEWEVRQVGNRGFIRESFVVPKALSWMIATRPADLSGEIPLQRRNRS